MSHYAPVFGQNNQCWGKGNRSCAKKIWDIPLVKELLHNFINVSQSTHWPIRGHYTNSQCKLCYRYSFSQEVSTFHSADELLEYSEATFYSNAINKRCLWRSESSFKKMLPSQDRQWFSLLLIKTHTFCTKHCVLGTNSIKHCNQWWWS